MSVIIEGLYAHPVQYPIP